MKRQPTKKAGGPMTKAELAAAYHFLHIWQTGNWHWEALDPDGYSGSDPDRLPARTRQAIGVLRNILGEARMGLYYLTNRFPNEVGAADFNTESPAGWTQLPFDARRVEEKKTILTS